MTREQLAIIDKTLLELKHQGKMNISAIRKLFYNNDPYAVEYLLNLLIDQGIIRKSLLGTEEIYQLTEKGEKNTDFPRLEAEARPVNPRSFDAIPRGLAIAVPKKPDRLERNNWKVGIIVSIISAITALITVVYLILDHSSKH